MAGLDPAIHAAAPIPSNQLKLILTITNTWFGNSDVLVDGRVKPGDDGEAEGVTKAIMIFLALIRNMRYDARQ